MKRRNSLRVTSENAAEAAKAASEMHFSQQLQMQQEQLADQLQSAEQKILSHTQRGGDMDIAAFKESVHATIEGLGRSAAELFEQLSELHRKSAREALKAQASVFETKLDATRTAAAVEKQEQVLVMEAEITRKLEATAMAEGGDAMRKNEELSAENNSLKMKLSVLEETLREATRFKGTAEEALRCKELLENSVMGFDFELEEDQGFEDLFNEFLSNCKDMQADMTMIRDQFTEVLEDMGMISDENVSLERSHLKCHGRIGQGHDSRKRPPSCRGHLRRLMRRNVRLTRNSVS